MSFMDRLKASAKDISGVGLNADEQFTRAYERGVLLKNYSSAIDNFISASQKYTKEGNTLMASRANANAALYHLVESKDPSELSETITAIGDLVEIEKVGSQRDIVPTSPIIAEMQALIHQDSGDNADSALSKCEEYNQAGNTLTQMGNAPLEFSTLFGFPGPHDNAMIRGMYYLGLSDYYKALSAAERSPSEAHNLLQKSSGQFQQVRINSVDAGLGDWELTVQKMLEEIQLKRHCWVCRREMQGQGLFFNYYPAQVREYHSQILEDHQEDQGMLKENTVVLCTVCGSAIENQADKYAKRRTEELAEYVTGAINAVNARLDRLEEWLKTHRHN